MYPFPFLFPNSCNYPSPIFFTFLTSLPTDYYCLHVYMYTIIPKYNMFDLYNATYMKMISLI